MQVRVHCGSVVRPWSLRYISVHSGLSNGKYTQVYIGLHGLTEYALRTCVCVHVCVCTLGHKRNVVHLKFEP